MGFALANAAKALGAKVILVSGPTSQQPIDEVEQYQVETALEMHQCVFRHIERVDVFIATAAVSDYALSEPYTQKIKKHTEHLTLTLVKNPDIVADVAKIKHRPFTVGFAAETTNIKDYALAKLENKGLDMVVCNEVSRDDIGFDSDDNEITVLKHKKHLPNSLRLV